MEAICTSSQRSPMNGRMGKLRNLFATAFLCSMVCGNLFAQNSSWMSNVPDNTYVSQMSIPGVHDAGTGHGFTTLYGLIGDQFARTQDKTLTQMWNSGIRCFDLRPALDGNDLRICHGYISTNLMFSSAISTLCGLLDQYPSETAIIVIRHEVEGDSGSGNWNNLIKSKLSSSPANSHTINFNPKLKMGDVRHKLIVLCRDTYDNNPIGAFVTGWGNNANFNQQQGGKLKGIGNECPVYIQDFYDVSGSGAPATKTASIQRLMQFSCTENKNANIWVINHTSGYSKTFLGIVTSDGYRDNAQTQNQVAINYLNGHPGSAGIVVMDYGGVDSSNGYNTKGQALTNALINQNFREGPNTPYFRALPTLTINTTYNIYTTINGTKYYITTNGTLTSSKSEAGAFTAKVGNSNGGVYGDSFFFEFTVGSTNYHFTNPNQNTGGNGTFASNNNLVPICGYDWNRIWDSQILLQNSSGKYAIRATNAPATGNNWNLYAANTYWSVKSAGSNPVAGYVMGVPDYRWQFSVASNNTKEFAGDFEDDETAIESITSANSGNDGAIYNMAGQRISKLQKGINIVNGKKIVVR